MSILAGCEMITDIGLDKFVMVSQGDARAQVVAAARQISIARAVLLVAAMALLAPILARAFGAGEEQRIVAWLGVVPLIESLKNWRIVQVQQDYRYGPEAVSNIGGQVAAVVALAPAYALFHDERVIPMSLIVGAAVSVTLSYVLAPRERVTYVDPAIRRAALNFGLPLMANGIGLVALKQLDQVIVANLFGLPALAFYSLVLNLAIAPTSVLQIVGWKVSLPFLGRSLWDNTTSCQASLIVVLGMIVAAAAFAIPIGVALSGLAPVVYGPQYQVSAAFSALAMLAAFLRFSRGGPSMVLLNHGQTGRLTAGNLITAFGMLVGLVLGLVSLRLEAVLVGVVIGDLLSFILMLGFSASTSAHVSSTATCRGAWFCRCRRSGRDVARTGGWMGVAQHHTGNQYVANRRRCCRYLCTDHCTVCGRTTAHAKSGQNTEAANGAAIDRGCRCSWTRNGNRGDADGLNPLSEGGNRTRCRSLMLAKASHGSCRSVYRAQSHRSFARAQAAATSSTTGILRMHCPAINLSTHLVCLRSREEVQFPTVEQLAAIYVRKVREMQERGPYQLCGHSFGGLVVYEMAAQLAEEGEEVGLLALIDTLHPRYSKNLSTLQKVKFHLTYFSDRLAKYGRNMLNLRIDKIVSDVLQFGYHKAKKLVWKISRVVFSKPGRRIPNRIRSDALVLAAAWRRYVPKTYDGRLLLLNALERASEYGADRTLGWKTCATGAITIHIVPGDHYTIMHPPHVGALIERLTPYLVTAPNRELSS